MENFSDIKLASYSIKKEYYPEKGWVKCPDCPKLLHCSYCVQYLRSQIPHHWVGIKINEVPGCRGCEERYLRGITAYRNEALWLRKKMAVLEVKLSNQTEDMREAQELAEVQMEAKDLAYLGVESVTEMNLRVQLEELRKSNQIAESIVGMTMNSELERYKEAYEALESRVTFLKRRPPDVATACLGPGSTSPFIGDLTFVVQGREIHAHQLLLVFSSGVFRELLKSHLPNPGKISETLKDVEIPPGPVETLKDIQITPEPPPLEAEEDVEKSEAPLPWPQAPPSEPLQAVKPKLQLPPSPSLPPENIQKEKKAKTFPLVKVRLVPSPMLAQMGLRGVRCNLLVVENDQAESATSPPRESLATSDADERAQQAIKLDETGTRTFSRTSGVDAAKAYDEDDERIKEEAPSDIEAAAAARSKPPTPDPTTQPEITESLVRNKDNAAGPLSVLNGESASSSKHTRNGDCIPTKSTYSTEEERENDGRLSGMPGRETNDMLQPPTSADSNAPPEAPDAGPDGHVMIYVDDDISYAVMHAVVNFCYTAGIDFSGEVSPNEVLKVAHKYEIDYLRDICDKELCRRLNSTNLPEMLKLGRQFGARKLHSMATKHFKENFDALQEIVLNSCC